MPTPFIGPPDEMAGLTMFLDSQREAILRKVEGLSTNRRRVPRRPLLFSIVMTCLVDGGGSRTRWRNDIPLCLRGSARNRVAR
jgi:hypothetical protein